ncbi:hypothetical protein CRE_20496 [Caenorhabditis remanei]|uniref:RING-type domain-containing protein n=1 Tax=Caenorhabditis remanei TaxID=31234 RepID=E3N2W1_CAERE|nr:hypothetical protein CRE_20496 [Caenorhabditis remanei]
MTSKPFSVLTKELVFLKNKSSTQTIRIERLDPSVLGIRASHNLPECFTLTPSQVVTRLPYEYEVYYDSSKSDGLTIPETMYIKFTEKIFMAEGLIDGVTIRVRIVEKKTKLESLECKLCLLQFSEEKEDLIPRILTTCGHTICQSCVNQIKPPQPSHFGRNIDVQCPFDRKSTNLPPDGMLPKNFTVIEMLREHEEMEILEKLTATKLCEDPDVPCFENSKHESTCYCTSCKAEFCEGCFEITHASKIFSSHKAIPIDQKPVVLPNCEIHPDNLVYYLCKSETCQTETKLFCDECKLNEHESHEHDNLAERVVTNQDNLKEIIKNLKSTERKFQLKIEIAQTCGQSYRKDTKLYTDKVESIKRYFEAKKEEALKKLDNYFETEREKLEVEREEIEHGLGLVTEVRRDIEKMLKRKNNLYDVEEIMEKGNALCSLEAGSGTLIVPFSRISLPDDMSTESLPIITFSGSPSTDPANVERESVVREILARTIDRRAIKATRKYSQKK